MHSSTRSKFALSLLLSFSLLSSVAFAAQSETTNGLPKIACELEGNAVSTGVVVTSNHAHSHDAVTKSLWGNLLLNMAYQQDAQLQSWLKTLHRVDTFTLGSVTAISGLSLAQSIHGFNTRAVEPHPKSPGVLAIISASSSVGSLAVRIGMNHHYGKRITKRQTDIKEQVQGILGQLKDGTPFANVQPALISLVGEEATQEFSEIWQATHPVK
jgi:hypothetical protein